jgi:hypothetical protein
MNPLEIHGSLEFTELSFALRSRRRQLTRVTHALNFDDQGRLVTVSNLIQRLEAVEKAGVDELLERRA